MFKYNANKQAYIADIKAGTYAQLVEAAESCQLGIIHPGKPTNPNESRLARIAQTRRAIPVKGILTAAPAQRVKFLAARGDDGTRSMPTSVVLLAER
jgi:hypothetical protein